MSIYMQGREHEQQPGRPGDSKSASLQRTMDVSDLARLSGLPVTYWETASAVERYTGYPEVYWETLRQVFSIQERKPEEIEFLMDEQQAHAHKRFFSEQPEEHWEVRRKSLRRRYRGTAVTESDIEGVINTDKHLEVMDRRERWARRPKDIEWVLSLPSV